MPALRPRPTKKGGLLRPPGPLSRGGGMRQSLLCIIQNANVPCAFYPKESKRPPIESSHFLLPLVLSAVGA
jgi:hypothetical protein